MEFKPQVIPNKKIETENQPFSPEKFLDWDPFNSDLSEICFSAIDDEYKSTVNYKIKALQTRVNKYLDKLNIPRSDYNLAFEQIIKNNDITHETLQKLSDLVTEVTDVIRLQLPEAETIEREEWVEKYKIVKVNQLLGYTELDFDSSNLNIHVLPNRTTLFRDKLKFFKEGFQDIAKVVNSEERIKKIVGDSWIVLEHPELAKKLGFKVEKDFKKEFRRIFIEKTRKKSEVTSMSREDFLKKYLIE